MLAIVVKMFYHEGPDISLVDNAARIASLSTYELARCSVRPKT